jgi:hypothetical protein
MFSGMDIYTSAACQYPGTDNAYMMFPSMYYHYTEAYAAKLHSPDPKNDGTMDIQFAVSRDGQRWSRLDRQPFISLGPPGAFDSGYAYMASGMFFRPDEVWLYYSTADFTHGNYVIARDRYKGAITRARLRLDGFVSADVSYQGGGFTTPVLTTTGSQLYLNATTSAGGYVSVGVQDESGKDLPGYTIVDCVPVTGDRIKGQVAWQAGTRIPLPPSGRVRLVFSMRDTKLYSFQFAN